MGRRKRLPETPFLIEIDRLEATGRCRGTHEGELLEVFDALPGETVRAKYLFGRRFRGMAQAVEVVKASVDRVTPSCPHFGSCSACSLQHVNPGAQIASKQDWLLRQFEAHGGLKPDSWLPPLQAGLWHYRRKARLSVRYVRGKGRVLVGFRERDGRFVTDTQECRVLPERLSTRLPDLADLIGTMDAAETIPQLEVTCGDDQCVLVLRHLEPLTRADRKRLQAFSASTGLVFYLQSGGPQTVEPLESPGIELGYHLPEYGLDYRFQPQDFIQVNAGMNRLMIRQALELLELGEADRVLELFAGLGNFTLPMARHCRSVTAVEGDAGLVGRAEANARLNKVENVCFTEADLYREDASGRLPEGVFDKVLLDPPRSGAGQVLQGVFASGARRLVYVSCNPETLAADSRRLVEDYGYRLAAAGVMDMFPHTTHVESMALFTRQ